MSSKAAEKEFEEDEDILAEAIAFEEALSEDNQVGRVDRAPTVQADNTDPPAPFRLVPLKLDGGTFVGTVDTAYLLAEIGGQSQLHSVRCVVCSNLSILGGEAIRRMTSLFYERGFRDRHFSKFVADFDTPHAERLGNWIVEKMTGEGKPWTLERVERTKCPMHAKLGNGETHFVHDRTSAHKAAWFSPKRPDDEMGDRFNLRDSRVWMRLMFWAGRDAGLFDRSPSFAHWFVRFIQHFIAVYERSAPPYAAGEFAWSSNPTNVEKYQRDGFWMTDLLGPGAGVRRK
jgi:hypothetical protein